MFREHKPSSAHSDGTRILQAQRIAAEGEFKKVEEVAAAPVTDARKVTSETEARKRSIINAFILGLTTPEVLIKIENQLIAKNKKPEQELKTFIDIVAKSFGLILTPENQWGVVKNFLLKKRNSDPQQLQNFLSRPLSVLAKKLISDNPQNLEQHREATFSEFLAEFKNYATLYSPMWRKFIRPKSTYIEPVELIPADYALRNSKEPLIYTIQHSVEVFRACRNSLYEILKSTLHSTVDKKAYDAKLRSKETKNKLKEIWINKGYEILFNSLEPNGTNALTEHEIIPLANFFGIHLYQVTGDKFKIRQSLNSQDCIPSAEAKLDQYHRPEINLAFIEDPAIEDPDAVFMYWKYVPTEKAHAAALEEISRDEVAQPEHDEKPFAPRPG